MRYNKNMDFAKVLKILIAEFEQRKIPYALIGAVALGFSGIVRATKDVDFAVAREFASTARSIMEGLGYSVHQHSDAFAQFVHDLKVFGDVDFVYLSDNTTHEMLDNAMVCPIADGTLLVKVARPEDIFILKMVAMHNNPKRAARDLADMRSLAELHSQTMDWNRIEHYGKLLGMEAIVHEIRG
jgi:predicted nucleotidyltransferase